MKQKWLILIGLAILAGALILTSNHQHTEKTAPPQRMPQVGRSPESTEQQPDFWVIEPGVRVGPITAHSTFSDLQKSFGAANVKPAQVGGAEGEAYDGVLIYPLVPEQQLEVIWKGSKTQGKTPEVVIIQGKNSLWHTDNGISLGTSLKSLETMNGGPFTLAGFDWDYGGTVLSWGDKGKLKEKFQKNGNLILRLEPAEHAPPKQREAVLGDGSFSSADPNMQAVRPTVREITVMFP